MREDRIYLLHILDALGRILLYTGGSNSRTETWRSSTARRLSPAMPFGS